MEKQTVLSGIDRVAGDADLLPDLRYGLVTAAHARSLTGVSSRKLLAELKQIKYLFSPEHGLDGAAAAGAIVSDDKDSLTGLPVYSLYQSHAGGSDIPGEILDQIDAFLYDLPDLGVRYYTYISTCFQVIRLAEKNTKKLCILDRPNPLGCEVIEGATIREADYSFVGAYNVPVRYALTIGELAKLYVAEQGIGIDLEIIPCKGYSRTQTFPDTGQVFTVPSPNIPNFGAALLYPGTCIVEGCNMSEGRGTSRPFSWFGAPWVNQEQFFDELKTIDHPGLELRPQAFTPTFSKYSGEACYGIAIEITDPQLVRSHRFMVQALARVQKLYPQNFSFIKPSETGIAFMDKLMGSDFGLSPEEVLTYETREEKSIADFRKRIQDHLIYGF